MWYLLNDLSLLKMKMYQAYLSQCEFDSAVSSCLEDVVLSFLLLFIYHCYLSCIVFSTKVIAYLNPPH